MKPTFSILLAPSSLSAFAEVDKDALPMVEDGFEINFFVREPHIIYPSSLCFDKRGRPNGKKNNPEGKPELYKLIGDPHELTNLADKHPKKVQALTKSLNTWWDGSAPKK
jgi:hypothetical protein